MYAMEPREPKALRLSKAETAEVQTIADRHGLPWSETARRMLAYAARHMPEGWHVGREQ